jgi:hypothetical protein
MPTHVASDSALRARGSRDSRVPARSVVVSAAWLVTVGASCTVVVRLVQMRCGNLVSHTPDLGSILAIVSVAIIVAVGFAVAAWTLGAVLLNSHRRDQSHPRHCLHRKPKEVLCGQTHGHPQHARADGEPARVQRL